jgi:hypothetical protein
MNRISHNNTSPQQPIQLKIQPYSLKPVVGKEEFQTPIKYSQFRLVSDRLSNKGPGGGQVASATTDNESPTSISTNVVPPPLSKQLPRSAPPLSPTPSRKYFRSPTKFTQAKLAADGFYQQGTTQQSSSVLGRSFAGVSDGVSTSNNLPPSTLSRQSTKRVSSPEPIAGISRSQSPRKHTQPKSNPNDLSNDGVSQQKSSVAGSSQVNQLSKNEPSLSSKFNAMTTESPIIASGSSAPNKNSWSSKDACALLMSRMSGRSPRRPIETKRSKSLGPPKILRRSSRTTDSSNAPQGGRSEVASSITGSPRWPSPSALPAVPRLDQNQDPTEDRHNVSELKESLPGS